MNNTQTQAIEKRNIKVRIMPGIKYPKLEFLRFQAGEWEEEHLYLPPIPRIRSEVNEPVRRFHLLGFGKTREAALAMAGVPEGQAADDTDPLNQFN